MTTTPDLPGLHESNLDSDDDAVFDDLARRAGAALRHPAPADGVRVIAHRQRRQQAVKATAVGAVAVATLVGALVIIASRGQQDGSPPVDTTPSTLAATTTPGPGTGGESAFAAAIAASGVLTSPSAEEVAEATDGDLYKDRFGRTQVSAAGNSVSLLQCRPGASATCGTRWAFMTRAADGDVVHGGLLGDASGFDLHVLDDRYFVASQSVPDAQAPATAWLIDAVSGRVGPLSWRDDPTTLNSPEQALLLCQDSYNTDCAAADAWDDTDQVFADQVSSGGTTVTVTYVEDGRFVDVPTGAGLPKVIDARNGAIRPLALPDDVEAGLPVAQLGSGRIWVGTDPDGDELGLAYSDDGGATWTHVALPEQVGATNAELATSASNGDKFLEIAADGDRVAVADAWGGNAVYVSDDAGRNWTTATPSDPHGNGARLYVLADRRLVLTWSMDDHYPTELRVSTDSHWAQLERVDVSFRDPSANSSGEQRFSVNRAGIALIASYISPCEGSSPCTGYSEGEASVLAAIDVSADLAHWSTIGGFDD